MSIDLKVTLGTVNYTNYLHVTAAKVSAPSTVVWETWIDVPVSNYNFTIPGLDPENYLINYYDAATNVALGTLVSQLIVNALSPEYAYEKKYYKTDRGNTGDPASGDTQIIDPYFTNKEITGVFKEGFRDLEPVTEWEMTTTTTTDDTINILTGVAFNTDEIIVVSIKLAAGTVAASNSGSFYSGRVDVSAATYTCLLADKGKRHRLVGTGATQVITLPSVASMSQEDTFLFDNSCGGTAKQVKIVPYGSDVIFFNGFNTSNDNLSEIWVSKGEKLLLARVDGNWEVIMPYMGANVGERFSATYKSHPNTVLEDGQIGVDALDGDEYARLWWWVNNVLPSSHKVTDDTVVLTSYTHPAGKEGLFVVHSTLKKFRTPNTQGLSEKGLKDFDSYGADTGRVYDYPGGVQNAKVMKFWNGTYSTLDILKEDGTNTEIGTDAGAGSPNIRAGVNINQSLFHATENIVKNFGVVYLRRI